MNNTQTTSNKNLIFFKGKNISKGRYEFNKCLPEDYPLIDEPITKKIITEILNDIILKYPTNVSMKILDDLKDLGFKTCTESGYTLSLFDLYDEELLDLKKNLKDGDIKYNLNYIKNDKKINKLIKDKDYYKFITSGARGSVEQVKQLIFCRGYLADAHNNIRKDIIKSCLLEGFNEKEFFESSYGARKGLMDTAVSTGQAGYLTRQLVYSTIEMELGENEDCDTDEYLNILISYKNDDGTLNEEKTESLAKSLVWRYIVDDDNKLHLVTMKNYKQLYGKRVKLRSPIFCKDKKICKKCYGNLYKILHSDQIGVIATQAIGERSTQLVLSSFHSSGAVSGTNDSGGNDDIIDGMDVLNKMLHGAKNMTPSPVIFVKKFQNIFSSYGCIHLVHFEVITSAMMWHGDKKWRLLKDRKDKKFTFESILQIPSKSSWLVGSSFSRIKTKLLEGLIDKKQDTPTALSEMFRY